MLFNSIEFGFFLPIVFLVYWFLLGRDYRHQNIFLLLASYFFYGWWDYRFLGLLAFSSLADFFIGMAMSKMGNALYKKILLSISLITNLGILWFFKYYNFFVESFSAAFTFMGAPIGVDRLNIILPLGISFYTFQTLSYSIDIYRGKIEPVKSISEFFVFVSFFPQMVAGPIERASNLLPQFMKPRKFDYAKAADGMRQILWGLFKKIVIADNCAVYVNDIFSSPGDYQGSTLFLGAILFAVQIYGDFSGYSDVAIGVARLFGFSLMRNFAFPYFSRDIAEFWRRWHISLTTWFRDYLYIPLGGSYGSTLMKVRNVFIIFIVSGIWHGANWTFVVWGALNAVYFLPLLLTSVHRSNVDIVAKGKYLPSLIDLGRMMLTFFLTIIAWVFFRAESLSGALDYLGIMFSDSLFRSPIQDFWSMNTGNHLIYLFVFIVFFILLEWFQREKEHALEFSQTTRVPVYLRWSMYYGVVIACFMMNGVEKDFIYFQF
ncbi:MBOAT family O-acyltransferase [Lunatimonas salinarum]|uniref:MBOAT family O-acyltransferase n=1 Tax=Lunatimonas salinarum TaxID=1774590 RepID=UPI001AE0B036|nr:MBOAT family protein [Lunatimonas salinarum]